VSDDDLFQFLSEKDDDKEMGTKDATIEQTEQPIDIIDTVKVTDTVVATPPKISVEEILRQSKKSLNEDYQEITLVQFRQIVDNYLKDFVLIDARRPEDFNTEQIPTSITIYPYDRENEVIAKVFTLPFDKNIIVYCDGGNCDSSHLIADILNAAGYTRFYLFNGG
jgi:rhodanese-related sulfurtransferase